MALVIKAGSRSKNDNKEYKMWVERLGVARKAREIQEVEWERYLSYYKNQFSTTASFRDSDEITVNQVFVLVNIYESVACAKDPYMYVRPRKPDTGPAAVVNESLLNYYWRELGLKKMVRRATKDAILCSFGCADLGYSAVFGNEDLVRREGPYIRRLSPFDIWLDPDALYSGDEDEYFRINREIWPFHLFKEKWPEAGKSVPLYKASYPGRRPTVQKTATPISRDDDLARVAVYRAQDLESNELLWFCDGYDDFLLKKPNPYNVEGFLTELLTFHEVPEEVYSMSVIRPAEGQQLELNKIRTSWMRHRKRFNRRYIHNANAMTPEQKEILKRGEDGSLCEVTDVRGVIPLQDASMPPDIDLHENRIKEDWRDITVINEYLRSGQMGKTKTAYEASEIVAGSKLRLGTLIEDVRSFQSNIARKLLQILQQYLPEPIVVQIAGSEGQNWVQFTREQIQGEFDVSIFSGEMLPPDRERERVLAERFYQTFRPDPNVDQRKILRKALEMWGVPDPDGYIAQGQISPFQAEGGGPGGRVSGGTQEGILKALRGGVAPQEGT